jgi:hypothetical protein
MIPAISNKWLSSVVCCALLVSAGTQPAQAGEKRKFTATATSTWNSSENLASPADPQDLLVYRAQRLYDVVSSDPVWNGARILEWEFGHEANGTGIHKGYDLELHRSGDKVYQRFEGTHKMVKPYPEFEYAPEGRIEYLGGTGKFKNLTGKGTYKAVTTAAGTTFTWQAEVEY